MDFRALNEAHQGAFAVFGPMIGHYKLSDKVVAELNDCVNETLEDFSDHLVGKVKQELKFDNKSMRIATKEIAKFVADFQTAYQYQYISKDPSIGNVDPKFKMQMLVGWFVRQFAGEYNPLHQHGDCDLSCVGYLKIPDGIEAEWLEDSEDHAPTHGQIHFTWGTPHPQAPSHYKIKPKVGDFFIFPSALSHCVYPFYSDGERRSFSMNLKVTPAEEQHEIIIPT